MTEWGPDETQALRSEIRRLSGELEQAGVVAEEHRRQADRAIAECARLRGEIEQLREVQARTEALERGNSALRDANSDLQHSLDEQASALDVARKSLKDRESRLSLAMRHAHACAWDWEPGSDRLHIDESAHLLHGLPRPLPATRAQWLNCMVADDRAAMDQALLACAAGRIGELIVEYRIESRGRPTRWLVSRGRLVPGHVGRPSRVIGLTTDITARKLNEAILQRNNEDLNRRVGDEVAAREEAQLRLFQKQKLEALGQLTGGVAHDFNNLLAVIGNSVYLLRRVADESRRAGLLQQIETATRRGAELTRRLLTFGRRQEWHCQTIELQEVGEELSDLMRHAVRSGIEVRTQIADDLWPIAVDYSELQIALLNLCVNARDAISDGGIVELSARNREFSSTDAASLTIAPGDYVELTVADNGCGMSAETLQRIFEPFFTTKDVGQGTGLGLAQVYGFAQQSRGTVHATSRPGHGTVISIILPRARPREGMVGAGTTETGQVGAASVLLVEDDEALAPLVVDMLQRLHYQTTHVTTARPALERLRRGERYAAVLSDVMLPAGVNGLELARVLREEYPDVAVVLTTGYGGELTAEAVAAGLPLVLKPYHPDDLEQVLRDAITAARRSRPVQGGTAF